MALQLKTKLKFLFNEPTFTSGTPMRQTFNSVIVTSLLLSALCLQGCGKKGPLYLPDEKTNTQAQNHTDNTDYKLRLI